MFPRFGPFGGTWLCTRTLRLTLVVVALPTLVFGLQSIDQRRDVARVEVEERIIVVVPSRFLPDHDLPLPIPVNGRGRLFLADHGVGIRHPIKRGRFPSRHPRCGFWREWHWGSGRFRF